MIAGEDIIVVCIIMIIVMLILGYCVYSEILELKQEMRKYMLRLLDIIDATRDDIHKMDKED